MFENITHEDDMFQDMHYFDLNTNLTWPLCLIGLLLTVMEWLEQVV